MTALNPEKIWTATEEEITCILNAKTPVQQKRKIHFYAPSFAHYKTSSFCSTSKDFPTISITGNYCSLNCKHCGGKILETMHTANTPEKLFELCKKLKQDGALGILISGGSLPDGSVPFQKFIDTIGKIKHNIGLTVFVHTGIVNSKTAISLKDINVDAVLIDIIGSNETIQQICNLTNNISNYEESLKALSDAGIRFVPHIIAGLHYGKLKGELAALKMIKQFNPSGIVIISFMPIHGTVMEKTNPPNPIDIARITTISRIILPKTPIVLGCMRPKGKHRSITDVLAIKAGVDGIAFPSEAAIQFAKKENFEITFSSFCCAQIYKDLLSI